MTKIEFLGAMATVGASGVLVDTGSERFVFDYGVKIRNEMEAGIQHPPLFPWRVDGKVNAICLSHAHLDHSGGLPIFFKEGNPLVFTVDVTRPLTEMLLNDSLKISKEEGTHLPFNAMDVKKTARGFRAIEFRKPIRIGKSTVVHYDAGHIPGSMMSSVRGPDKKTVLYTGDFNTEDTRLVKGADKRLPKVDALITETTYADRDHPDRHKEERNLVKMVNDTLANDGIAVISSFAISRTQEILLILDKFGIDYSLYVDGMAKKATTVINRFSNRLRDPDALDKALKKVKYVNSQRQRKKIIKQPCVILTTSGMLSGGPVSWYLRQLYKNNGCSLTLTGFQVEGTPGRTLMETGRYITDEIDVEMKMRVRKLDFSSHIGRKDLMPFIKKLNPERVFCVHGDRTDVFARELRDQGFDAVAPMANNRIFTI